MPNEPKKPRPDFAQNAFRVVQEATGQKPKTMPPHLEAAWEKWLSKIAELST